MARRQCTRCKHTTDESNFQKHKDGSQCLDCDKRRKDAQREEYNEQARLHFSSTTKQSNTIGENKLGRGKNKTMNDLMKKLFVEVVVSFNFAINQKHTRTKKHTSWLELDVPENE